MRILILGNDYSARKFFELFSSNKENIVFSNIVGFENYIEFKDVLDIVDFCEANDINLVLIIDEEYINQGLQELISAKNISAFSPSIEAIGISSSKANAKKFMHKNKIPTSKFQVAETPKMALDYIRSARMPLAIRPDNHNFRECTQFCETFSQGKKIINDFFFNGNKKIVIEDYIEGKNFSVWTLSDGFSAHIIGISAKYQNDVALFKPNFVTKEIEEKIYYEIIVPTIGALSSIGEEYIGVLGFDCMIDKNNDVYLLGYNSFFDDINVDFFIHGFDVDWAQIFDSAIVGDVFLKYTIEPNTNFMASIRQGNEIEFFSASTRTNLNRFLAESGCDLEEFEEAKAFFKV